MSRAPGSAEACLAPNVASVTGQRELLLRDGWELCSVEPGRFAGPHELADAAPWKAISAPGPVAAVDEQQDPARLDASDHWFRCRFSAPPEAAERVLLSLDGLATLADAWLNGEHLLRSDNMFVSHCRDVSAVLREDNELLLRFSALLPVLQQKRGRGAWPTRLVSERHLRFVRTALLGYTPGFCPEVKPVGPWRPVRLVQLGALAVERAAVQARLDGDAGRLEVDIRCLLPTGARPDAARLVIDTHAAALRVERRGDRRWALVGELDVPQVEPWWPHTHGTPALYAARVELQVGDAPLVIDLGKVGFRSLELLGGDLDRFQICLNGEPIFCRGACWNPIDLRKLHVDEDSYRVTLGRARDAGMNMLRITGTTCYESDTFYRVCDELGILVWQDLMFANMDYPRDDGFRASARLEVEQLLERTTQRCSLAVLCGSSELQQQAAMMGRPATDWAHPLFDQEFPELRDRLRPELIYVPSSPCRGDLPMHVGAGPSHYYGVGAYKRPLQDATLAGVRFASECLAFANVPEHDLGGRAGVPRDVGASWDFADVTEHYLEQGFGVRVAELDRARYAALSRVTSGELIAGTLSQWRSRGTSCSGALIYWLRDLAPGAGVGLLDSDGSPKSAYHYFARACQPSALWLLDRGLDGLTVQLDNERASTLRGELEVVLFQHGGHVTDRATRTIEIGPRAQLSWNVEGLLGHFTDPTYSYRFGPLETQLVLARFAPLGAPPMMAFHLPGGWAQPVSEGLVVHAQAKPSGDGGYRVKAISERFAQAVAVRVEGCVASNSYFHLAPGVPHDFELRPLRPLPMQGAPRGTLWPLNAAQPSAIVFV